MSGLLQGLSNGVYRSAARVASALISRSSIVRSVYAQGSVAVGGVSFGRSDIDLLVVVRDPESESADGPELADLYRKASLPRHLGHIQIHGGHGLERWIHAETYRGYVVRRTAMLLSGKPASMPCVPVRREHAIRRFSWYPAHFFSAAVRERNHRNLQKIATEMWNAYAVAQGVIPEPDLTLKESAARSRTCQESSGLAGLAIDPERAPDFVFGLAQRLHDALLPPLKPLREPIVFRSQLPPRSAARVFVIVPRAGFPAPAEARHPLSFFATPELLHMFLHYVNPFLAAHLPPELWRLGFTQPAPGEFVRACTFFLQDGMLRHPGFAHKDAGVPRATVALSQHSVPYLLQGETPPPIAPETVGTLLDLRTGCSEYYQHEFGQVYWQAQEQLGILEGLERRFPPG